MSTKLRSVGQWVSGSVGRLGAEEQFDDVTINDIYCHRAIFTLDSFTCKQGHGKLSALLSLEIYPRFH
ncbi:MAG: hypothetical protein ABGX69_00660 [Methylococcales bacterium]